MRKVCVNTDNPYEIMLQRGIFKNCSEIIADFFNSRNTVIVTDETVYEIYGKILEEQLLKEGFKVGVFVLKDGEKFKNLNNLSLLYEFLSEHEITRDDFIIALGGGVVGDFTGFAAASFLRGISFIQIPTTLVAQVDSSIGGKTAVNIKSGKNLVGAFHQPSLVICDPDLLSTLSYRVFCDGMGEVIKCAVAFSEALFIKLSEANIYDILEEVIFECILCKKNIIENDEYDFNNRMKLNFGHTVGHAIERYNNYKNITHGQAISIGMVYIMKQGEKLGITRKNETEKLKTLLKKFNLPTSTNIACKDIFSNSLGDKKRRGDNITIVVASEIGKCNLLTLSLDEYRNFLSC